MAHVWADRVRETSSTSGTGAITPSGAYDASYKTIGSVLSSGDTAYFAVKDGSGNWNVFLGTWNGTTVARTTILAGSSGTSAVNLSGTGVELWIDLPASAITAMLNTSTIMWSGIGLTGATFLQASSFATSAGNNDLYTCPSGKKAMLVGQTVYINDTGGSNTIYAAYKRSGTYYRLGNNSTPTAGTTANMSISFAPIMSAGESFAINDNNGGAGVIVNILECDDTNPIGFAAITAVGATNTIYTVPAGKVARMLAATGESGFAFNGVLAHINMSGGAITRTPYYVPNGSSASASNQLVNSGGTSTSNNSVGTTTLAMFMAAGDSIQCDLSGTGATQLLGLNYYERSV